MKELEFLIRCLMASAGIALLCFCLVLAIPVAIMVGGIILLAKAVGRRKRWKKT